MMRPVGSERQGTGECAPDLLVLLGRDARSLPLGRECLHQAALQVEQGRGLGHGHKGCLTSRARGCGRTDGRTYMLSLGGAELGALALQHLGKTGNFALCRSV